MKIIESSPIAAVGGNPQDLLSLLKREGGDFLYEPVLVYEKEKNDAVTKHSWCLLDDGGQLAGFLCTSTYLTKYEGSVTEHPFTLVGATVHAVFVRKDVRGQGHAWEMVQHFIDVVSQKRDEAFDGNAVFVELHCSPATEEGEGFCSKMQDLFENCF